MADHGSPPAAFHGDAAILERTVGCRTVVVDDHRLLAQMLTDRLHDAGYDAVIADVAEGRLADRIVELSPRVVVLDAVFNDDESGGLRVLEELSARGAIGPDLMVVILTGVVDELRHAEFLDAGARAVITKADSVDGVVGQIDDVVRGGDPMGSARRAALAQRLETHRRDVAGQGAVLAALSDRELATLQALVDGLTVDEIALRRTVAKSTVRSQVRAVLRKLGAHSQVEAVSIGVRAGLLPRDERADPTR